MTQTIEFVLNCRGNYQAEMLAHLTHVHYKDQVTADADGSVLTVNVPVEDTEFAQRIIDYIVETSITHSYADSIRLTRSRAEFGKKFFVWSVKADSESVEQFMDLIGMRASV